MKNRYQKTRLAVQVIFFALVLYISVGHYLAEKHIAELPGTASLHAVCPFGGVVTIYNLVTDGSYIQKIHPSNLFVMGGLFASLALAGAFFCGWICPLGSVQEWVGKLGKKVLRSHYNKIPVLLDKILKFGKYLMLLFVIIQTARTATLLFSNFDPYYNLFNIWTDEIAITGYIAVILTLGASFFVERPFCRYACPLGAITGLFNSFSLIKIRRRPSTCIDCGLCDLACPVGIDVSKETIVRSPACNRCLKCVAACPTNENGTLVTRAFLSRKSDTRRKEIPARIFILVAALAFVLPITVSVFAGAFETEKARVYVVPEDIKGSSSFAEIIDNYSLSREQLFNSLGIPESTSIELKIKDLTGILGFAGEEEVISREHIALMVEKYNDPITSLADHSKADFAEILSLVESVGLNESDSVDEIMKKGPRGLFTYLFSGRWPSESSASGTVLTEAPLEDHGKSTPIDIKGSTSLSEISSVVEDFSAFLEHFGIPEDEPKTSQLKDLKTKYSIEISEIKEYLSDE
ncbi:MAG: 4Fe-4S binding protein [Kosmotogaceae bacterium]|nr:4Fe-4S binding protein [Kosmotogaceae bacterium]